MRNIVIFGIGKIAEVVLAYVGSDPELTIAGFTCDHAFMKGHEFCGLPLVAFEDVEKNFPPDQFAMMVAIGYHDLNRVRASRFEQAQKKGYRLASWISPRAHIPAVCKIGVNCMIFEGATLQPHAQLGDDVFVWNGAVVGHHASIADHCWLASNCTVSSTAVVEPLCFLGVNAAVGHAITIGARTIIGAGTIITRSTAPGGVYLEPDTERFRLDSEHFLKISRLV